MWSCLQTQTVSDRDAHDQEVEGLERKLTEAEREAAAANVGFPLLLAAGCPDVTFIHRVSCAAQGFGTACMLSSKTASMFAMFVLQLVIGVVSMLPSS